MRDGVIYIKAAQSSQVVNRKILLSDVLEIYSVHADAVKEIGNIVLYTLKGDKNQKVIFSLMKIIQTIQKQYPDYLIENIGEPDFVVEYHMPEPPKKGAEYVKLILLSVIVFVGAAFTIMTFNTDVSVSDVFDNFYKLVTGSKKHTGTIMETAYCLGIFLGVMGFYNHFRGSKVHDDPTPIHVEMRNYEEEKNKAIINDADREGKTIKN